MKVSSIRSNTMSVVTQLGKDIGKPGIYKSPDWANARLIVLDTSNKFYWVPGSGPLRLQTASASLNDRWYPVNEKITVTFDTTEE